MALPAGGLLSPSSFLCFYELRLYPLNLLPLKKTDFYGFAVLFWDWLFFLGKP